MPYCIVQGCPSGSKYHEEGVILHVFPPKKETVRLWLSKIDQDFGNVDEFVEKVLQGKKSDKYRICSKHFRPECYYPFDVYKKRLRPDAVPSIFEHLPLATTASLKRGKKRPRTEHNEPTELSLKSRGSSEFCKHCRQRIAKECIPRSAEVTVKFHIGKKDSMTQTDPYMGEKLMHTPTNVHKYQKKIQCMLREKKEVHKPSAEGGEPSDCDTIELMQIYENGDFQETPQTEETMLVPLSFPSCRVTLEPSLPEVKHETSLEAAVEDFTFDLSPIPVIVQVHEITPLPTHEMVTTDLGLRSSINYEIDYTSYCMESSNESKEEANHTPDPNLGETSMASNAKTYSENMTYSDYVQERKFIVFESCLDSLIRQIICQKVSYCNQPIVHIEKERIGSYISVYGTCARNHRQHLWQSQPRIGKMPVGNLLLSSAIVCSGSSYLRTERFLNLLGVLHIDKSTYNKNQQMYFYPTINQMWEEEQQMLIKQFGNMPICVAGDGQSASPGHNAKYCMYSLMEVCTKKILTFNIEILRPGYTSVGLKKIACNKAIQFLINSYLNVQMVCTDRHVGIRKMMREEYRGIIHKFDVWHLAKSIGKKLIVASRKKNCSELANWVIPIKTHLWWCARTCEENPDLLVEKWNSFIHHVVNNHSWNSVGQYKSCSHDKLSTDVMQIRKWIHTNSTAHKNLKQIVLNQKLQKDLRRLSHFCHPCEFEILHRTAVKYCPKRTRFSLEDIIARTQLSVLDHNHNVHHVQELVKWKTKFSGPMETSRFNILYSKARKKIANQEFIFSVIRQVLESASGAL